MAPASGSEAWSLVISAHPNRISCPPTGRSVGSGAAAGSPSRACRLAISRTSAIADVSPMFREADFGRRLTELLLQGLAQVAGVVYSPAGRDDRRGARGVRGIQEIATDAGESLVSDPGGEGAASPPEQLVEVTGGDAVTAGDGFDGQSGVTEVGEGVGGDPVGQVGGDLDALGWGFGEGRDDQGCQGVRKVN